MFKCFASLAATILFLFASACAPTAKPVAKSDPGAEATPEPPPATPTPVRVAIAVATVAEPTRSPEVPQRPPEVWREANPDWTERFQTLYAYYEKAFTPPVLGETVEVTMLNGQSRQGKLERISAGDLVLNVGMGTMTLTSESLADVSKARFFARDFAQLNALNQLRDERAKWTEQQRLASRPTPTPQGHRDLRKDTAAANPKAKPPRNAPPNGRVWQIEQYLRKTVAVPHSLRFLEWGRVHPHGDGYTVRCKYTVESADGFGKNTENMIFFMRADGTVYNKAVFKGDRT